MNEQTNLQKNTVDDPIIIVISHFCINIQSILTMIIIIIMTMDDNAIDCDFIYGNFFKKSFSKEI